METAWLAKESARFFCAVVAAGLVWALTKRETAS